MSKNKRRRGAHVYQPQAPAIARSGGRITADGNVQFRNDNLDAPRNVYDADFANVFLQHTLVHFLFGKRSLHERDQLRTRLEIKYPAEAFMQHFWGNSSTFRSELAQQVDAWPTNRSRGDIDLARMPSELDHSEWVNFDYMARHGSQASIDFFHIAPAGVAKWGKSRDPNDIQVESKVRVLLTIDELRRLLDACQAIAENIMTFLPAVHRAELALNEMKS